jgi:MFS family permease
MKINSPHDSNPFAANISRYFVYTVLKGFGFGLVTATWVIYLQRRHGLNLTQVTLIDVAFWIAATLGEIPTGIVADTWGRKTSIAAGAALMGASILAWAFAPTVPLIMAAYALLAVGTTFLSGAEDAFFYESVRITGRGDNYARLVGRVSAIMLGATALGNLTSGLLASIDLILPFIAAGLSLLTMLGVVLTFKEPQTEGRLGGQARKSYRAILQQSVALMRARPTLRYSIIYLVLLPMTAVMMETVFLQPQAISLGVPIAGVGAVVMAVQIVNMAGSTVSDRVKVRFGEGRVLYTAPVLIVLSLVLLAAFQVFPALLFVAVVGFVTSVLRPLVLSRIQNEVPDDIRATILSMQSLMFTILVAIGEPIMGFIADQAGLPMAYAGLAGSLSILIAVLLWISRRHFPRPAAVLST